MKLTLNFELGHKDIQEWLVFAIPLLAGFAIVVGITVIFYVY